MSDKIEQQLGIDASQALATLTQLEAKFASFGAQLSNVAERMKAFNTGGVGTVASLRSVQSQAESAAAALSKFGSKSASLGPQGKNVNDTLDQMKRKSDNVTLSWQTFGRVLQTQALIRGLNIVRDCLTESSEAAIEFQKRVAEISAINPERSFSAIASNVRELSDAFNQPIARVTEAQYQTISDQFVSTAEQANILTAANLLAKTGGDDLAASAQLLTGALNAYGESSEMAGLRAAQFFEAVNVGRFRMSELGTALSRTQAIGFELGVSLEELQSALATITIGGVKANEASTQLRGVMNALLKPSDEMEKAFKELGVSSGEAAIKTFGLSGTLDQLWSRTDETATGMSKLFANVRGAAGALRLAGSGAENYAENLARISKIDQETLQKKFGEFTSTDSEKYTRELNKVTNFFTAEFGVSLLQKMNKLVAILGGGEGMVGALRLLTGELPLVAGGIGLLTAATRVYTAANVTASASITGLAGSQLPKMRAEAMLTSASLKESARNLATFKNAMGVVAVYAVGRTLGNYLGDAWIESLERNRKALEESRESEMRLRKQKTEAAIREESRKNTELLKGIRQQTLAANKLYQQEADDVAASLKRQEKSVEGAFDSILSQRKRITDSLQAASITAATRSTELAKTIDDLKIGIEDSLFSERAGRLPAEDQFSQYILRAKQVADDAANLTGRAFDDRQQAAADKEWQRAKAFVEMAKSAAAVSGNLTDQERVSKTLRDFDESRIQALHAQQGIQAKLSRETQKYAEEALARTDELDLLGQRIQALLKTTAKDAEGNFTFKGKEQFKKGLHEAEGLIEQYKSKLKGAGQEDSRFFNKLGAFEDLQTSAEMTLASYSVSKIEATPQALADLYSQVQTAANKMRVSLPVILKLERETGLSVEESGYEKLFEAYGDKLNAAAEQTIKRVSAGEEQKMFERHYADATKQFEAARKGALASTAHYWLQSSEGEVETKKVSALIGQYNEARHSASLTSEQLDKLKASGKDIDWAKAFPYNSGKRLEMANALQTMMESLGGLQRLQGEAAKQGTEPLKEVNHLLDDQASTIQRNIDLANRLAQAWGGTGTGGEYASLGGTRYFDRGGSARGIDTVPAMLSPGEFVMNAASTRRFSSQLIAMNAGIKPTYHNEGGNVTNIGDINVTVPSGGSSQQTARQIAQSIKRELRRGTSTL